MIHKVINHNNLIIMLGLDMKSITISNHMNGV